ncbi:hypothetical protein CLV92_110122 [Kineococcus xinjiangensis]|uniref:Methyltransferase family protein n=1 Tax=Kineococcus xinjiangensis TaxID=512762 RepID=A0A2S6IH00_9ACTN|nr:hypothetical protein [Kineococcus xinjiangensis]PPK93494.1 hypothetical protein CLV92_110122 [Kineococcus xinjiangensis]
MSADIAGWLGDAPAFDAPAFDAPAFDAPAFDAPAFDALTAALWAPVSAVAVQPTAPLPGERVLDACAGAGASALPLARAGAEDVQVTRHPLRVPLDAGLAGALVDGTAAQAQLRDLDAGARAAVREEVVALLGSTRPALTATSLVVTGRRP